MTRSIIGQVLGQDNKTNKLVSRGIDITRAAVDASITVSDEGETTANTRDIVVTLLDSEGVAISEVEAIELQMFLNAAKTAYVVTGGSTGISLQGGGDGALLALVAKKIFVATTEATGILELEWLDTGSEAAFLGVKLPNGRIVMSTGLANST